MTKLEHLQAAATKLAEAEHQLEQAYGIEEAELPLINARRLVERARSYLAESVAESIVRGAS